MALKSWYGNFSLLAILLTCSQNTALATTDSSPPAERLALTGHPTGSLPSIGDRFTLQCNVWNRKDNGQASVWFKNSEYFASNGDLQGAAMDEVRTTMTRSMIAESSLEIDTLTINNLQIEDQANYTCQLWAFKTGAESDIVKSASFILKVQDAGITTSIKPECSSSSALQVPLGEVVPLSCQVDLVDGMTAHHLYWTGGNKIYQGVTTIDSQANTARMVLHFIMTEHYHNVAFVCHVNQTNGSEINYNTCTVGPFIVLSASKPVTAMTAMTTAEYETQNNTDVNITTPSQRFQFMGSIFIIVAISGMALLCCVSCLACYFCCCRKTRRGEYRFGSRFSVKRKPLVPTPSGASDVIPMPHPRQHNIQEFESPYYSSVGPGGEGRVKLPYNSDRSAADGASYTALQKTGNNSNSLAEGKHHSADVVDEDGYNVVGLTATLPSESKLGGSSSSLLRGFSLNSLTRHGSRSSTRPSTPVPDEMPYYKTLMRDAKEPKLETPYYLSVFPPGVGESENKVELKIKAKRTISDIGKSSTVPKSLGATNIDRKRPTRNTTPSSRELLTMDDDYLCPTPTITSAKSDPKFSNAIYNVF